MVNVAVQNGFILSDTAEHPKIIMLAITSQMLVSLYFSMFFFLQGL
jgi:hypothetical protein